MQFNDYGKAPSWKHVLTKKNLLVMKLIVLLLTVICFQVNAKSYAQQVTLKAKNASLEKVFEDIYQQTGYQFVYTYDLLHNANRVTIDADRAPLKDVLSTCFRDQPFTYILMDKAIIVIKKPTEGNPSPEALKPVQVNGRVTDDKGNPLAGVTIKVKNGSTGGVTDANGNYSVTVPDNAILIVSYIGYQTQEIPVDGKTSLNIVLKASVSELNQLVVIGYGVEKKRDLTGSIVSLSAKELNAGGTISNVAQAIQGRAAGVQVIQNSGAPGGSISIRIRGNNSINSSNEPLYVVDGFPTTNGLDINPNDIASIQILKGASATAIYGSRGANGVVIITTKQGRSGQNSISYNGYTGVQILRNPFQMLDGKQYMQLANALYAEIPGNTGIQYGVYTPSQLQSNVNTNWVKETTHVGNVQSHNLQFQGGGQNTDVFASLGYFNQDGVLKNTNFNRISGMINVNQKINDYVKAGASLYAQREMSNVQQYGGSILNSNVLYSILTYDPTVPAYNPDGSFGRPPGGKGDNPLANLIARQFSLQNDKLDGHVFLEIDPVEGLQVKVDGAAEILHGSEGSYLPKSTYQGSIDNGDAGVAGNSSTHQLFDTYITYNKKIDNNQSFNIMGGYSYERFTSENSLVNVYGFSTDLFSFT